MKRDKQVKLILWLEDIEHITPLWVKLWLLAQKFVSLIEIHFPTGLILGSLSFSSLALLSLVLTFVFKLSIQRHMFNQINVRTTSTKKQSKQQKPQPLIPIYQTSVASRQVATNKSSIYPSPNAPCMEYLPAFIIKSKPFMQVNIPVPWSKYGLYVRWLRIFLPNEIKSPKHGSLYYQPKQCTIAILLHCLIPPNR